MELVSVKNCGVQNGSPRTQLIDQESFLLSVDEWIKRAPAWENRTKPGNEIKSVLKKKVCELTFRDFDLSEFPPIPPHVTVLNLCNCHLSKLSGNLSQLTSLYIWSCSGLTTISDEVELTQLENFEVSRCHDLEEISAVLDNVVKATIDECSQLKIVSSELNNLVDFKLVRCLELQEMPSKLVNLVNFSIDECCVCDQEGSTKLPSYLPNLTTFSAIFCPGLSGLPYLPNLVEVHIKSSDHLTLIVRRPAKQIQISGDKAFMDRCLVASKAAGIVLF